METATARFVAFADSAPMFLTEVEDLHETDHDAVLGDRLADSSAPAAPAAHAGAVAGLLRQPGRAALLAHELSNRAALLALLAVV